MELIQNILPKYFYTFWSSQAGLAGSQRDHFGFFIFKTFQQSEAVSLFVAEAVALAEAEAVAESHQFPSSSSSNPELLTQTKLQQEQRHPHHNQHHHEGDDEGA